MVDFNMSFEPKHPPPKKQVSLDEHLGDEDVAAQALRIAVEQHEKQHKKQGEKHNVQIRERERLISEDEERVIEEIKRHDQPKDEGYKMMTAEEASGSYGGLSGGSESGYGDHSHQAEASCTCGWRATPENAMNEFMQTSQDKKKEGSMYGKQDDDGDAGGYGSTQSLEGMTHGYVSNMGGGDAPSYQ